MLTNNGATIAPQPVSSVSCLADRHRYTYGLKSQCGSGQHNVHGPVHMCAHILPREDCEHDQATYKSTGFPDAQSPVRE